MRSFIKTHRRAASLDNSPSKSSVSSDESRRNSQGSFGVDPTTYNGSSSPSLTLRHASSFEPLHKLTSNKIFNGKLFKKSGSSVQNSVASTPVLGSNDGETFQASINPAYHDIPVIKGTRKHEWGDFSEKSDSVIVLNRTSVSSASDPDHDFTENEILRIPSSEQSSSTFTVTPATSRELSGSCDSNSRRQNMTYRRQESLKKKQNRLARIHSHDDIINLSINRNSAEDFWRQAFSPTMEKIEDESPPSSLKCHSPSNVGFEVNRDKNSAFFKKYLEEPFSGDIFPGIGSKKSRQSRRIVRSSKAEDTYSFEYDTESNETKSYGVLEKNEVYPSENRFIEEKIPSPSSVQEAETDDDDDDVSSKFSFENGNDLAGRTASQKYYSTEKPDQQVYINDLYENDNFDEEMNYCDFEDEFREDTDHLFGDHNSRTAGFADLYNISEDDDADANSSHLDAELQKEDSESPFYSLDDGPKCSPEVRLKNDVNNETAISSISKSRQNSKKLNDIPRNLSSFADIYSISSESDGERTEVTELDDERTGIAKTSHLLNSSNAFDIASPSCAGSRKTSDSPSSAFPDTYDYQEGFSFERSPEQNFSTPKSKLDAYGRLPMSFSSNGKINTSIVGSPRKNSLKFYSLNSNWDNEFNASMNSLFYIDDKDEAINRKSADLGLDDSCLDEINGIPEDFEFYDYNGELLYAKSPTNHALSSKSSCFRRTHSYSEKPTGLLRENSPIKYQLEIKNRKVTFFDHVSVNRSFSAPQTFKYITNPSSDDEIILENAELYSPVTPNNSFSQPSPNFNQTSSLSPIQESSTSSDASPRII